MTKDPYDNDWFVESEGADDPGSVTLSGPQDDQMRQDYWEAAETATALAVENERLRQQLADARTILNTAPAQTWVQALRNKLEE